MALFAVLCNSTRNVMHTGACANAALVIYLLTYILSYLLTALLHDRSIFPSCFKMESRKGPKNPQCPFLFILYTSDVISIAASLGVGAHSYADDSQLFLHCLAVDQSTAALRLAECIERVEGWMKSNRLKLNSDRLNSCGLDPDSSWRRSTQRP